jgi:hypothetical protein
VLADKNSIVISEDLAMKLFNTIDIITMLAGIVARY